MRPLPPSPRPTGSGLLRRSLPLQVAASALRRPPRHAYGPDPAQVLDLHVPRGTGTWPVVVLLHGGFWQARYGRVVCRPLALDLVRRGFAVANVEYRRLGARGGWPATFADVAAGIDAVRGARLDLSRVALVGHSAGGALALWAAGREALPPGAVGAGPVLRPGCVVALAPVTALQRAGRHAVELVGGTPAHLPDRWAQVDPLAVAPPPVPTLVVHPAGDTTIPLARSVEYVERCTQRGGDVRLVAPEGEAHRDPIDPGSASWATAATWLAEQV